MRAFYSVPLAVLALIIAMPVSAAVPSPTNSTIPSCLHMCPFGDMTYTVVIRDFANNPIAGSSVVLDFSGCPSVRLCPPPAPPSYSALTNAQGVATFAVKGGGGCISAVNVYADGVWLTYGSGQPNPSVASPDQDGNRFVTVSDQAVLSAKTASDPTADLNCDGTHNAADDGVLAAHLGHYCDAFVPGTPHTWGKLKVHYR